MKINWSEFWRGVRDGLSYAFGIFMIAFGLLIFVFLFWLAFK